MIAVYAIQIIEYAIYPIAESIIFLNGPSVLYQGIALKNLKAANEPGERHSAVTVASWEQL